MNLISISNRILPALILLMNAVFVSAQKKVQVPASGTIRTLAKVVNFQAMYPQEKVYLHFDNTGYFMGENIWYKAYVTRTDNPRAKTLSSVLYVELLSPGGDVLDTQKLHIDEHGQADGSIRLDSILGSGFYEVRAYTRYMVNWGADAVFSRVFPVFETPKKYGDYSEKIISRTLYKDRNPNIRKADSLYLSAADEGVYTNDTPKKINVAFYPEGGDLVLGLRSKVAFVAVDDNGGAYKGVAQIKGEDGKVISEVTTDSLGRGVFEIVPDGQNMTLSMTNPKNKIQQFPLPAVKAEGCVLAFDAVSDSMHAVVYSSEGIVGQELGYALMHDGNIYACDTMQAVPIIDIGFMRDSMPEGVNQLTIFNNEGRIMADRLFFVCPRNGGAADSILFNPISHSLAPCSIVELEAMTQPNTTFSFSAVDYGSMSGGSAGNMKTWMLLGSDVKGYIRNPEYYFEADDAVHRKAADLLMMVQGWRRYDWKLMSGQTRFYGVQPIEDKLYVHGQLKEYRKRNPVGNVNVNLYLFNKSGQSLHGSTRTDSLGYYAFEVPDISGDWELQMFTLRNDKRKTYYVGIDRQFSPTPRYVTPDEAAVLPMPAPNLYRTAEELSVDELKFAEKTLVIPPVTIKAKRRYWTDDSNIQWYNQNEGRKYSSVYYNMKEELDRILDQGEAAPPTIFDFLLNRNPLFGAQSYQKSLLPHQTAERYKYILNGDTVVTVWVGGMAYAGRPIHWVIDNGLGGAYSDLSKFVFPYTSKQDELLGKASFQDVIDFPEEPDQIKAVYIVPSSPWEEEGCVRIYLYRQLLFTTASQKGLRRTTYQGYNEPETFQMEDYKVLPPLENNRRTLYWNPNVKADAKGKALIQFTNNISCRQIFLSAEGVTPEGKIVVSGQ